jgi:hypothetical protein
MELSVEGRTLEGGKPHAARGPADCRNGRARAFARSPETCGLTSPSLDLLLFAGLLPLWLVAGWADWLCHRVQRIEHSSGMPETLMHGAMLLSMAVAVSAALLLEIDAAVLLLVAACCVVHEAVVWCDLVYADRCRRIPPAEQWVHAIQIAAPWVGLVGLGWSHADQVRALWDGSGTADWSWRAKAEPLPLRWLTATAVAALLLVLLPFADEWRRARRAQRRRAASASPSAKAA